jgi:hypothetical protein
MARIKIKDLPKDQKISKADLKKVLGGLNPQPEPPSPSGFYMIGGNIYTFPFQQLGGSLDKLR